MTLQFEQHRHAVRRVVVVVDHQDAQAPLVLVRLVVVHGDSSGYPRSMAPCAALERSLRAEFSVLVRCTGWMAGWLAMMGRPMAMAPSLARHSARRSSSRRDSRTT